MPVYEYRCECGARFERSVAASHRHDVRCDCGKKAVLVFRPTANIFSNRRFADPDNTVTKEDVW